LVDNLHNPHFVNVLKIMPQPVMHIQPVMMQPNLVINPITAMMGNHMVGQVNQAM